MVKRSQGRLVLALVLGAALISPTPARATSSYYAAQCASCHGASPTTCNGCHHHRGTLTGSLAKTTFTPGETMTVTVGAGQRSGWWRAAILDGANTPVRQLSATATGPTTVAVPAPDAAGTYRWKVAWYGNRFGDTPGADWVADGGNSEHGWVTAALEAFTVETAPAQAPVAGLSPAALDLGAVTIGQASTRSATVSNTGTSDLAVGAPAPCGGATNAASLTLSPAASFTVAAGGSATLTVSFAPTAAGAASACWSFGTNDPARATLELRASGTAAVAPPPPATCTGCHALPPSTGEHAAHASEGCGACHGAGYSDTAVVAGTHDNGTVDLASSAGWDGATTSCANACHGSRSWGSTPPPPTPSCTTCHGTPPTTGKHGAHARESCGACHGAGYSPTTVVSATHQDRKVTLGAESGWRAASRSCANACHGSRGWSGGSTGACSGCHAMPPSSGRHTLHRSEHVSCAACHGSGYSTTTVNATTHDDRKVDLVAAVRWDATRRSCSNSCHDRESWGGSTPPPSTGCTGCHRIPPASGEHAKHQSKRIGCGSCHGSGYSSSTVNASTHRNGKVNLSGRIGFNTSRRTCSNSCHGSERWLRSKGGGDDHEEDDFVVAGVPDVDAPQPAGGCSTGTGAAPLLGLLSLGILGVRRRRTRE